MVTDSSKHLTASQCFTPTGPPRTGLPIISSVAADNYLHLLSPEIRDKLQELEGKLQLPPWPRETRGIPNICLRSALFGLVKRGNRQALKNASIFTVKGLTIRYTGWQLDQGDFDVLVQALHLHQCDTSIVTNGLVCFKVKSFLKAISRQPGKSGREWLKDSFRRLTANAIEIDVDLNKPYGNKHLSYAGSLIDEFYFDEKTLTYFLRVNPKLSQLFDTGWTQLQWQQRLQLKTDLARWLHGFYASHHSPYPMLVITYMQLCGSHCRRVADFRRMLRSALSELQRTEIISSWKIDRKDKVHVQKSPSE